MQGIWIEDERPTSTTMERNINDFKMREYVSTPTLRKGQRVRKRLSTIISDFNANIEKQDMFKGTIGMQSIYGQR